jgi:hypothetical protein
MRIELRKLIVTLIVMLMATSSAFARKASQHHSKRAVPNHHSTIKTDQGGVARDPADVELDRKIGSLLPRLLIGRTRAPRETWTYRT